MFYFDSVLNLSFDSHTLQSFYSHCIYPLCRTVTYFNPKLSNPTTYLIPTPKIIQKAYLQQVDTVTLGLNDTVYLSDKILF